MPFHILPGGFFHLLFIDLRLSGGRYQCLIVIANVGANHHLKLSGIGETAFHHGELLNFFRSGIGRLVEDKAQASNTVAHRRNIAAPTDQFNQPIDIRLVHFAHHKAPWQMTY